MRHGVMLVGPTGGGKTTVYTILADTLETLYQSEHKDSCPFYQPVKKFILNPKSVTMGELYGEVLYTVNTGYFDTFLILIHRFFYLPPGKQFYSRVD